MNIVGCYKDMPLIQEGQSRPFWCQTARAGARLLAKPSCNWLLASRLNSPFELSEVIEKLKDLS